MPTSEDLDDPAGFSKRRELLDASDSDVDAALRRLLEGGFNEPPADEAAEDSGSGASSGNGPETGEDSGDDETGGEDPGKGGPSA